MFERYTEKARLVIFYARKEASELGDVEIKAIHLLLALLQEGKAVFFRLQLPEGKLEGLRQACVRGALGKERVPTSVDMPLDEEATNILRRAEKEADSRKSKDIDVEHLLLGSLQVPGKAKDILQEQGLGYARVSAILHGENPPLGDALDYT